MKRNNNPTGSTDRLCAAVLAGLLAATVWVYEATDGAAIRAAEVDKPPAITVTVPAIDMSFLAEALKECRRELFWGTVPLSPECRSALVEACEAHGVALCDALGVMEVESGFDPEAVSSEGCVGLMQLNTKYFPAGLSPEDNIRAGVAYLGALLERYEGDTQAALTAYNAGHDTGSRTYANAVLAASERWGAG